MEKSHAQHIMEHIGKRAALAKESYHFVETLCAAEFHWFFVQGLEAIRNEFYIPGVSSFLNGIEASLRVTLAQISATPGVRSLEELSPYRVLSNNLILNAKDAGMPVQALQFPGEVDFLAKLNTVKPNVVYVEVVRHRNNICHGDIFEFINRERGPENSFFTPESIRPLAFTLIDVSRNWSEALGKFRRSKGLLQYDRVEKSE